ncbi:MAG: stage V sporulation protein AD [Clostridioides sp.]|jgi:stage V sporulation protein AD|nr:stage V sporulation protein AD [Clostridioides sp.]
MEGKRIGRRTLKMKSSPVIIATSSIVGEKEGLGPLGKEFDVVLEDDTCGEKSWEKAETKMFQLSMENVVKKSGRNIEEIQFLFAGDLINQITPASFSAREMGIPFFGIYGACSTMSEGMALSAMAVDGGFADLVLSGTSSHYATAERQFRFPLEMGNQKPMTSQRTVTGAGSVLISSKGKGPKIKAVTIGKVVDKGIKDPNNMGAAMAPAAVDTIYSYFEDTLEDPNSFDVIATGDLGTLGSEILIDLLKKKGLDISKRHKDCGVEIFYLKEQDVHCGASGCGCAASVFTGVIYKRLLEGKYKKVMLVSTGALLSPMSTLQKESIPCIAHAVVIEN